MHRLSPSALDLSAAVEEVSRADSGAVSVFVGTTRDHNRGKRVRYLEYEAYEPLAIRSFERIAAEADARWPGTMLAIHHRTGRVDIGQPSVVIAAASAHRAEAFAASRYAIERLKQIAPIWKHEYFDGGEVWIEGATARIDDEAAREAAFTRACG